MTANSFIGGSSEDAATQEGWFTTAITKPQTTH
jgi:hypothetical protein